MKLHLSILPFLVAGIVVLSASEEINVEKECKRIQAEITKRVTAVMGPCSKSITYKDGKDKTAKQKCVIKCVMLKLDFLSPDGTLTVKTINDYIEKDKKNLPEGFVRESVRNLFMECVNAVGSTIDPSDPYCKSYGPYLKCVVDKGKAACNI